MGAETKVYLITGFLGSGKTTFLNRVIHAFPKDRKLMILMNEFGEVGVDGTLVEGEDLDLLEISKGSIFCVCVKTDFIKGLHEIARTIQPDVLIVESTGVANPSDLKRDLELPFFQGRFRLAEQFCVVDASTFEEAFEVFASVEKQIASSTVFLINKVDLATPEQVARVKELVARHHPAPRFFETTYAEVPVEELFFGDEPKRAASGPPDGAASLLSDEELEAAIDKLLEAPSPEAIPPDRLLSAVYTWDGGTRDLFEAMAESLPKGIVRAKGFVTLDGRPWLFSWVMGRWTLEEAALKTGRPAPLDRLVFIAPPEVMGELAQVAERFAPLHRGATFDPMERRG
ncbi:MAG: GTP-binding protein [Deferrisomatales bacterium]